MGIETVLAFFSGMAALAAYQAVRDNFIFGEDEDPVLDILCASLMDPHQRWERNRYTLANHVTGVYVWVDGGPYLWRPSKVEFSRKGKRRLTEALRVAAGNSLHAAVIDVDSN